MTTLTADTVAALRDLDAILAPVAALETYPPSLPKQVGAPVADQLAELDGRGGLTIRTSSSSCHRSVVVDGPAVQLHLYWSENEYTGRDNGWKLESRSTWPGRRYRMMLAAWGSVQAPTGDMVRARLAWNAHWKGTVLDHADVRAWLTVVDQAAEAVPVVECGCGQQDWECALVCGARSPAELDRVVRPVFEAAHPVAARAEF